MNTEQAQKNMIDSQIKTWNVFSTRILEAFAAVDRANFVPAEFKELAFADCELDIGGNSKMNSPKLDARILQAVEPKPSDRILEIGTGTGFLTALLSKLGKSVCSIEIDEIFYKKAKAVLEKQNLTNIELILGDGLSGYEKKAPFDVIIVSGSSPRRLSFLENQLAEGGRMLNFIDSNNVTVARLVSRHSRDSWQSENLFETPIMPLIGLEPKPEFKF